MEFFYNLVMSIKEILLSFREKLKKVVNDVETSQGRKFALFIQLMIVSSLIAFSLGTLPGVNEFQKQALYYFEVMSVVIFTFEYLLRVYCAEKPLKFIFSFFGAVDLIAILPFYLSSGLDLRAIRSLRLLRIFRIFKLLRYNKAISRFHRAVLIAKEEIILFGFVSIILLYLSSVGIYYFENEAQPDNFKSVFHCLWWSVTTLTTVGYGDMYPITTGGKLFTFFVLMIGLGIVAIPAGLIASALSKAREDESI
ncbi:ion transporter [Microbulbifer sp. MLAF003]|uniref:ion transporter n=1 Tax=unclassified Microbulbifer TaxID=2619833 RepID=UPI0024AE5002|nr:ion transporter [Microbulbifer sp. MLAF003]WHI50493.1 ion transporter [Microbulbifer sp. MLAF003]